MQCEGKTRKKTDFYRPFLVRCSSKPSTLPAPENILPLQHCARALALRVNFQATPTTDRCPLVSRDRHSSLPFDFPRHTGAAYSHDKLPPQPLLDNGSPRQ